MTYFARTKDGNPSNNKDECQLLIDHLHNVSVLAKEKASFFGAEKAGELLGLLHDIGKYEENFQKRIRGEKIIAPHAMTGAFMLSQYKDFLTQCCGIIISSHHTGLPDWGINTDMCNDTYQGKLNNYSQKPIPYNDKIEIPKDIIHKCLNVQKDKRTAAFQLAMYIRMLFSVLVDADYTDSEEFCTGQKREVKLFNEALFTTLMNKMPNKCDGKVNEIRANVLNNCLAAAEEPRGLFTLTVPTGGGKTLSSLAFALKHAVKHNLRRIIYVIPYMSIIDQNASVIKEKLGSDNVLEHHSGSIINDETVESKNNNSNDDFENISIIKRKWAMENWDIPIILTTNVQFFESLFSAKTKKIRKIHNIADSVIIFDEAQMLPFEYLSPSLKMISELVENYGVSAVMCSATQPSIEKYLYKTIRAVEIANNPTELFENLKRVDFRYDGKKSDDEIVNEIQERTSALVVVNSRKHAFNLYTAAMKIIDEDRLFYLSTLLIPAHRKRKIKEIKERLNKGMPVIVISTQLIEAGVDLDFSIVYRSMAGIDSIIQAGGRANREGKMKNPDESSKMGEVIVFESTDEHGQTPKTLKIYADLGKEVIECLGDKSFGPEGIKKYFELLHHSCERDGIIDKKNILEEFEMDTRGRGIVKMNFAVVDNKYKIIEEDTVDIIIQHEAPKELIKQLRDGNVSLETIRELQQYCVSVYKSIYVKLNDEKAIENIKGIYMLVSEKYYCSKTGLDIFSEDNKNAECFFIE